MSRRHPMVVLLAMATLNALLCGQQVLARHEQVGIRTSKLADTDGDGQQELLLVQTASASRPAAILRIVYDATTGSMVERGQILLPDPAHTLVAIADILPAKGTEIVVADPRGTACHHWHLAGASEPPSSTVLARRARFTVRVDQPLISSFVIDLNQDGRLDLMLPSLRGVQPYLHEGLDAAGVPQFRRLKIVPVPVSVNVDPGSRGLDPELTGSLRIPHIKTKDLNGDGRPDLLTQAGSVHKFHLQDENGTFAPPIEIDIEQFEDSTPKAAMDFGSTAVLGDKQLLQSGDINGDDIPDYVIAHRRKIWTFLADENGPQFRKARTQAVADDVTAMLVLDIDEDERADLLTFRVQLPGIGTLLLGLVRSIDIDIKAVGYQSEATGFARKPKWRRTVTLRIPPILTLLSQQEELLERFTNLLSKTRVSARGHFLATENIDLVVVQPDAKAIELCSNVGEAPALSTKVGQRMLRELLFEDEDTVFDIDRMFVLISGLLDSMAERVHGDQRATAKLALRNPERWHLLELLVGELDGTPGDEVLVVYRSASSDSLRAFDMVSWR